MSSGRKTRLRVLRGYDVPPRERGHAALLTLIRVFGRMTDSTTRLVKEFNLTLPHFEVLLCLNSGEGISQQDLSERLLLTKGNICIIVQKMEHAGLLERRPDPIDQRLVRLYLTLAGRRLIGRVQPEHRKLLDGLLVNLNLSEQKTLLELLSRIDESLDEILV
jgi:DNA-binding MarR family transcriptional regulator